MHYPADPPAVEEIIAVMRQAEDNRHVWRLRALIVVLWRGGLRIQEALSPAEPDLDPRRGSLLVRHGKDGRAGVNDDAARAFACPQEQPYLTDHERGSLLSFPSWFPRVRLHDHILVCDK
jgi:integrase